METPAPRNRKLKARIKIPNRPEAVMRFEEFVRSLDFLSEREKMCLLVAGDEVVDNLLNHGEVGSQGIRAVVRKRLSGISLGIFVQSHKRFAQFAVCLDEAPHQACATTRSCGVGMALALPCAATLPAPYTTAPASVLTGYS